MNKTTAGLLAHMQKLIGTPYVYSFKAEVVTESLLTARAKMYPGTMTAAYLTKARKFLGQVARDCSGAITEYTGVIRGSENMLSNASMKIPISQLNNDHKGWILWYNGHVAVYEGNGYCIEARGIDYGVCRSPIAGRKFVYAILIPELDVSAIVDQPGYTVTETSEHGIVTTQSGALNIRSAPAIGYPVIGSMPKGTEFQITGKTGDWYQISYNGMSGYVSGAYVTIGSSAVSMDYKAGTTYTVVASALNVRSSAGGSMQTKAGMSADGLKKAIPTTNGKVDGYMLPQGTRVTCQQVTKVSNNTWIKIPSGWICAVENGSVYVK